MHLKSLELTGFKSFAKKTSLRFDTPITAIVGPNGSGKSNIAEAFRFALGEQSIKSMRGKRTEDLIWNGSPEIGRLNRASVKLFFDNRKRLLNLDFDEVILERVIYRDASSEYLLNGSQVRLRDIVELVSGANIGVSGHHIISQGEADRILNAGMKERREMIEDALGLMIYEWKREESERKLEKTKDNMEQVEGLRKEIAPHLSFLKRQVEKIEKTKALKGDLSRLYEEYLSEEYSFIKKTKTDLEIEEDAPKKELSKLEAEISSARDVLRNVSVNDDKTKAVISVEARLGSLRREKDVLSREAGRIEGEIIALGRIKTINNMRNSADATVPLSAIEEILNDAESVKDEKDSNIIRSVFLSVLGRLRDLLNKFSVKTAPELRVDEDSSVLREKKKDIEAKIEEINKEEDSALAESKKLRVEIDLEKNSSREAEKDILRIMARQNELTGIINSVVSRKREIMHTEEDFKREIAEGAMLVGREVLNYKKDAVYSGVNRDEQEEKRRKIERLKIRIEEAGAGAGADVIKEFKEATERDDFFAKELSDLKSAEENLRKLIAELEQKLDDEFRGGIKKINEAFQDFFSLMFGGGSASLEVVKKERRTKIEKIAQDDLDLVEQIEPPDLGEEDGIEINVSLPRKKIKGLMMLSGGERALTSIALLFAMSQVKPPPFIILDETDAALDEANSRKYGDMVENLSKHSQLILITHNRETMSRAGVIYGVTMDKSGVSKLLSIAFDEAVAVAK